MLSKDSVWSPVTIGNHCWRGCTVKFSNHSNKPSINAVT